MADATEVTAPVEPKVEVIAPTTKTWEDSQVKEIIGSRDEAKKARRDAEAALETAKAEADSLRKAQTQYQADLAAERKKTETYDAEQKKLRESLLEGITDPDLKDLATKENLSLEALMKLGKRQPVGPSGARLPVESGKTPEFDAEVKRKPGETFAQWEARVDKLKRPK